MIIQLVQHCLSTGFHGFDSIDICGLALFLLKQVQTH
jgi:hypothetical protein